MTLRDDEGRWVSFRRVFCMNCSLPFNYNSRNDFAGRFYCLHSLLSDRLRGCEKGSEKLTFNIFNLNIHLQKKE